MMLFTFFFSMVTFPPVFVWLLIHRFRLAWLDEQIADVASRTPSPSGGPRRRSAP